MKLFANESNDTRHNIFVNLFDGAFFGCGIGFASFSTIIPLFVSTLTNSALLIGLIPAIHNTFWQLPQVFIAKSLGRVKTFKPAVMKATIHERLPFLGLALVAWFLPVLCKPLALILSYVCLIWQGMGAGFAANPWQNMVSRVIPPDFLATFFGLQAAAANLLSSGGAVAAGFILEKITEPQNFTLNFVVCFVLMIGSYYFVGQTREPDRQIESLPQAQTSIGKSMIAILRKDPPFGWFLITRNLFQFGTMAFAFYMVYAVRQHGMSEATAGIMTGVLLISQTIASPLLGWLADHWSRRGVFITGAIAASASAFLAYLLPDLSFFFIVFILAAFANTTFWTIGMAYTMDFGTEAERPTYVGMANTLIAPSAILAPLIGGWIADAFGYSATFLVASIFGIVTAFVLRFLVKEQKSTALSQRDPG